MSTHRLAVVCLLLEATGSWQSLKMAEQRVFPDIHGYLVELVNDARGSGVGAAYRAEYEREHPPPRPDATHISLFLPLGLASWYPTAILHYGRTQDIYQSNSLVYSYDVMFKNAAGERLHWLPDIKYLYDDDLRRDLSPTVLTRQQSFVVFVHPKVVGTDQLVKVAKHLSHCSADSAPAIPLIFVLLSPEELPDAGDQPWPQRLAARLTEACHHPVPMLAATATTLPWSGRHGGPRVAAYEPVITGDATSQLHLINLLALLVKPAAAAEAHEHHHCVLC